MRAHAHGGPVMAWVGSGGHVDAMHASRVCEAGRELVPDSQPLRPALCTRLCSCTCKAGPRGPARPAPTRRQRRAHPHTGARKAMPSRRCQGRRHCHPPGSGGSASSTFSGRSSPCATPAACSASMPDATCRRRRRGPSNNSPTCCTDDAVVVACWPPCRTVHAGRPTATSAPPQVGGFGQPLRAVLRGNRAGRAPRPWPAMRGKGPRRYNAGCLVHAGRRP